MINNIWILIGKKLSGEASSEELRELEELLQQVEDQYPLALLEDIWKKTNQTPADEKLENKWKAFETKLDVFDKIETEAEPAADITEPAKPKRGIIKFIKIISLVVAASMAVVFIVFRDKNIPDGDKTSEITAPQNGISKVQLPDGSKVWLNSGSKLVYAASYGTDVRKVSLTGEALFDVVKDAQHPFIVTTPTISIKVLGTKFNVRAYTNDRTSEASLLRGKIELTILKNPEKQIILKANDKLTINNEQPALNAAASSKNDINEDVPLIALSRIHQIKQDTLPSEALWIENKLAFDAEDFGSLAQKLERRYNVAISFKNEDLKKIRFTGRFQNESITKALKALQGTTYFHYKTNNNQILVY
ncbi:FecR family protein [Mucilaginibacter pineti]|uniref:FecR family protein n=1 Tax=Mucilaginibacter pineti TaxID=1391627 RepID=A0A1G7C2I2_9SPHI|nr:FecR family protein [Mucilaginibacter pineti]SDE33542.1 FecR family protein [Mucilaginibacter pineti]